MANYYNMKFLIVCKRFLCNKKLRKVCRTLEEIRNHNIRIKISSLSVRKTDNVCRVIYVQKLRSAGRTAWSAKNNAFSVKTLSPDRHHSSRFFFLSETIYELFNQSQSL